MNKVLAFANQKGGVAKTTTTLNLGVALKEKGFNVLVVDLDPSGEPGSFPDATAMSQKILTLSRPVLNGRADELANAILSLERYDHVATATQLGRQ